MSDPIPPEAGYGVMDGDWVIACGADVFARVRADSSFHRVLDLARIINYMQFAQQAIMHADQEDTPSANRQRSTSFFFYGAVLFEALQFVREHLDELKLLPEWDATLGRWAQTPEVTNLLNQGSLLHRIRNHVAFHVRHMVVEKSLQQLPYEDHPFAVSRGSRHIDIYYQLADTASIHYVVGAPASRDEFLARFERDASKVRDLFMRFMKDANSLIVSALLRMGFRRQAVAGIAPADVAGGVAIPSQRAQTPPAEQVLPDWGRLHRPSELPSVRERELMIALAAKSADLAAMYEGALRTLVSSRNPDRLAQAAHSMRELMEKLPMVVAVPAQERRQPTLHERVLLLGEKHARFRAHLSRESVAEEVLGTHQVQRFLTELDEFFEWHRRDRPLRRMEAAKLMQQLEPSTFRVPEPIEQLRVAAWQKLRDVFVSAAHHSSSVGDEDVRQALADLEVFLHDVLLPRTFEDHETIDTLIREAERGA